MKGGGHGFDKALFYGFYEGLSKASSKSWLESQRYMKTGGIDYPGGGSRRCCSTRHILWTLSVWTRAAT